ncbi:MAG: N-acetylmuramoyl-L-alanine amidase [Planctomycetota bacterium]
MPQSTFLARFPRFETLEPRHLLSSTPLVPVGTQPEGGLSDKIVYLHAGHGYTANNLGSGAWSTQRGLTTGVVEDLGNQDQMTFLADYLFNAGATVVPLRPVGHQPFEVVVDNVDAGVTFSGAWSNSSAGLYFGEAGEVPYRFASTSATETAVATYRPDLPSAGEYPVYAWTRYGSDRAADQLYRVNHSGGTTEVTVNHRRVGNGLVYLGTYHFDRGTEGSVEISNRSSESGRVVIADMIRFGNGVGDIDRGGGVSGQLREDEAGLYWVQWHVDRSQGIATSEYRTSSADSSATVSLSPRYAEYMNREADGSLSDRVFVSFHSNAGGGSARGVLALLNGNNRASAATPNQFLLANTLGREVNDDLVAQNGQFEHNWSNRSTVTLDRSDIEFGEINNERINNEFDATIVETGFHDNTQDAQMLRDPKVRDALARATYQGIVNYFRAVDGNTTPVTKLPPPVENLRAQPVGFDGFVRLDWDLAQANSYSGGSATGYMVYTSTDGRGFDGGTFVAGGTTTSAIVPGLDPDEGVYYFKVAAVNDGGESLANDVVAATPNDATQRVLIVDGFDRNNRSLNPTQPFGNSVVDRVRPSLSNSQDYAVDHAAALEAWAPRGLGIATASNEAIIAGDILLDDYDAVFWILGEESTTDDTFDAFEQSRVSSYLNGGGKLFVSGAEIGWDLDNFNNGRAFYNQTLRADYVADDANSYQANGAAGSIFEGITLDFDDGTFIYDANFPDVINPSNGSTLAMTYGTSGGAAIQFGGQLVMLGFPFETILGERDRIDVMGAALNYFGLDAGLTHIDRVVDFGDAGYSDTGNWSSQAGDATGGTQRVLANAQVSDLAQWETLIPLAGTYELLIHHGATTDAATDVPYAIQTASAPQLVSLNQRVDAGQWRSAGVYELDEGANVVTLIAGAATGGTRVSADAIRWVAKFDGLTPGDADLDGDVDFADAMTLVNSLRSGGTQDRSWGQGDFDLNGVVDQADLTLFRENYQGIGNAPAAPAPPVSVLSPRAADAADLRDGERITPPTGGTSGFGALVAFAELEDDAFVTPFTRSSMQQTLQRQQVQTQTPSAAQLQQVQTRQQQRQTQQQQLQRRVGYPAPLQQSQSTHIQSPQGVFARQIKAATKDITPVTQGNPPRVAALPQSVSLLVPAWTPLAQDDREREDDAE